VDRRAARSSRPGRIGSHDAEEAMIMTVTKIWHGDHDRTFVEVVDRPRLCEARRRKQWIERPRDADADAIHGRERTIQPDGVRSLRRVLLLMRRGNPMWWRTETAIRWPSARRGAIGGRAGVRNGVARVRAERRPGCTRTARARAVPAPAF